MIGLAVIALFLLSMAFFAGLETAFLSIDYIFIEIKKGKSRGYHLLSRILQKPETIIFVCLIGTNICNVAATQILSRTLADKPGFVQAVIFILFPFFVFLFAELYPKLLLSRKSYSISKILAVPYTVFQVIFFPLIIVLQALMKALDLLLHVDEKKATELTREETKRIVRQSLASHFADSTVYIDEAAKFDEISLSSIKKPMNDYLNGDSDYRIMTDDTGAPIGYTHLFDIFTEEIDGPGKMHPVSLIYEEKDLLEGIDAMKTNGTELLVCINEYGELSGVITKEDLFEVLIGDFIHRDEAETYQVRKVDKSTWYAKGYAELGFLSKLLGVKLSDEYYSTLNGFLQHKTGRIPREGEKILHEQIEFNVISAGSKGVEKVIIKRRNG